MPCVSSDCFRHPWYQFCVSWQQIGSGTPRTGWAGILELPRDTKQIRGAAWCLSENALKYIFVQYKRLLKNDLFCFSLVVEAVLPHAHVFSAFAPAALCGWTRPAWTAARPGAMLPCKAVCIPFSLCAEKETCWKHEMKAFVYFSVQP